MWLCALKTRGYPNLHRDNTNEYRSRNGSRYLGGSFLQKPEMHVMNVMKASTSQGGPNKLSDEQVELTRKWISHNGIDNFCRRVRSEFIAFAMKSNLASTSSLGIQWRRRQSSGPANCSRESAPDLKALAIGVIHTSRRHMELDRPVSAVRKHFLACLTPA